MPGNFAQHCNELDPASARLLWAAWCVPARYRLALHLWRREARLTSEVVLRAKLRRLAARGFLVVRYVTGPGLVFDGQHWSRGAGNRQEQFVLLRLSSSGEALVRRALLALG